MPVTDPLVVDPWRLELIVVRDGSFSGGERRTLSRDVERGLLLRLRRGVYAERTAFESLSPEQQHLVRMRALAAAADEPVVFSHPLRCGRPWAARAARTARRGPPHERRPRGT